MIEFTIEREVFLKGLQKTLGIVERKATLPIMANVLIEAGGKSVRIEATDMELRLALEYPASVIKEGAITIPARKIYEAVRELAGETLHLVEGAGNLAVITSNKVVCKLRGLASEDFPAAGDGAGDCVFFAIKPVLLLELIGRVYFAVATDDDRKNLLGVFLQKEIALDGRTMLRLVATDGHRLAIADADMSEEESRALGGLAIPDKGAIIPRKAIQELRRILDGGEEEISLGFARGSLFAQAPAAKLTARLIDGEFPDWRRVIPEEGDDDVAIRVGKASLLHGLRRMGVIEPGRVDLTIAGDRLVLRSEHPDIGEIRDEIEVQYSGPEKIAAFSGGYLTDAVESVSGETVELRIPASPNPMGVVRDAEDDSHLCIVMGLKVS